MGGQEQDYLLFTKLRPVRGGNINSKPFIKWISEVKQTNIGRIVEDDLDHNH